MIEIVVDIRTPHLDLRLPAERQSLPIVRQALRSLGESVRADGDALDDAELAVTEACTNVVEHAYGGGGGILEVTLEPRAAEMVVTVRDEGGGIPADADPGEHRGFGLSMIEGIAKRLEVEARASGGTAVIMWLDMGGQPLCLNGSSPPDAAPLERITRRIVAVVAAQTDMPTDRFVESLLAVELAARHAPGYLQGDKVELTLQRLTGGFDLLPRSAGHRRRARSGARERAPRGGRSDRAAVGRGGHRARRRGGRRRAPQAADRRRLGRLSLSARRSAQGRRRSRARRPHGSARRPCARAGGP